MNSFNENMRNRRKEKAVQSQQNDELQSHLGGTDAVQKAVIETGKAHLKAMASGEHKVQVDDLQNVIEALNQQTFAMLAASNPKMVEAGQTFQKLVDAISASADKLSAVGDVSGVLQELKDAVDKMGESNAKEGPDLTPHLQGIKEAVQNSKSDVKVEAAKVDLKPLLTEIKSLKDALAKSKPSDKNVVGALQKVTDTISNLSFPVPNYVLPFKKVNTLGNSTDGTGFFDTQAQVVASTGTPAVTGLVVVNPDGSNVGGGGAGSGTSSSFGAAFPATGTAAGFSDGTNMVAANVATGDANNAFLFAGSARKEVSYSTGIVAAVASTEIGNYSWVSVHQTSVGTTSTTTFQVSNDNTNWVSIGLVNSVNIGITAPTVSITTAIAVSGSLQGYRYFRLNVTGISAGTTAGIVEFSSMPKPTNFIGGVVSTQGAKTNNNAAPVATLIGTFNSIANAAQPSWTEGFQVLTSADLHGNARTRIQDAAGNDRGANVTAANAMLVDLSATTANATAIKVDGSAVTQPISGTVTANAGTNLNTSLLALETGGNLATIASAVRAEDSVSADADKGIGALAIRKAAPANTSSTDGDYEYLQMNAGRLWASATIDTALPAGTNLVGKVGIDQTTVGTTNGVSVAQIGANTVLTGNGTTGTGSLRVTLASDNSAVSGLGAGATAAAVPANAVYAGGRGTTALPAAVTDGQSVGNMADAFGRQVVIGGTVRTLRASQTTTITASTSETTIVTAGAAGIFNDVVALLIANTSATATRVDIRDATAGSVILSVMVAAGSTTGVSIPGESWPQTTAASNWTATCGTSVTDVRVNVLYEKNK